MADAMRRAVTSVTDVVFPSPKSPDYQQQHLLKYGHEYVSNLPLQMSLYFNVFYSPLWLITLVVGLEAKYSSLSTLYKIIIIAILVIMVIVEVTRLYLGYVGNLMEQVPELAGSWLLTLLIQLPLILFLLFNESTVILPIERAVNIVLSLFIVWQVIVGYFAIRAMIDYQVTKFHQQQFSNLEEISPDDAYMFQRNFGVTENKYTQ